MAQQESRGSQVGINVDSHMIKTSEWVFLFFSLFQLHFLLTARTLVGCLSDNSSGVFSLQTAALSLNGIVRIFS